MTIQSLRSPGQRHLAKALVFTAATLALLPACSTGGRAFASIEDAGNTERVRVYESWDELLDLAERGEPEVDPVDAAIVGDVVDVQTGYSFVWDVTPDGDKEVRTETEFGSEDAMISTYHLTVRVTDVVGATNRGIEKDASIVVGIALDPEVSLEDVSEDFSEVTGAVFFLDSSPVFDYDRTVFAITEDGALMAVPDDDDSLSFPMLPEDDPVQPPDGVRVSDLTP